MSDGAACVLLGVAQKAEVAGFISQQTAAVGGAPVVAQLPNGVLDAGQRCVYLAGKSRYRSLPVISAAARL